MSVARRWDEPISLPGAIRFPVEMIPPAGFDPERTATWPDVAGRLEFVDGRLWYMPPCGDEQQDTVADVVITLGGWVRKHPEFVLGTNEAGMRLGGATRGADAAIWRRSDVGARTGGLRRHPPVLAVEVAGVDDREAYLRDKARWYFDAGVAIVWLILPDTREVVVLTPDSESRFGQDARLPEHAALPGLAPEVRELFVQLDGG
jgi:Uma2 family endonuclease